MADGWSTDTGEAAYRSRDAVKNLTIKIRIQRVPSTAALSQHLQQQVWTQQERGVDVIFVVTRYGPQHLGFVSARNDEELVVGWQEKLFSQLVLFQRESVCQTPLERQYHTEIMAQERTRGRQNCRIFTYTDSDCYTNWEGVVFNRISISVTVL
uniref:Uncharacterized protein n=1 Tax=Oncorhynchus kisutch TaxID=8019 RepID=A0A8C7K198_ONCKI